MFTFLVVCIVLVGMLLSLFGLGLYAYIWALTLPVRLIIEVLKGLF